MKSRYIFKGIKIAFFVVAGVFLMGYIVMSLWNCLVPDLFHGPHITYMQGFGLLILSKILFGGFKGRGWGGRWGGGCRGNHWKHRFEEKLSELTPEEREKLKEKMGSCCGM